MGVKAGDPMAGTPRLSVVIPAYNEARRIGATLERIFEYLGTQPYAAEVIVVDDGSRDRTAEIVHGFAANHPNLALLANPGNRGKGYAVRHGVLAARGAFVLFSDADLSTPIEEVEHLLAALAEGAEVAIGSRALAGSDVRVRQPWWRQSMGRTFNRFVRALAGLDLRDTQCGFKCFTRAAARDVFERSRIDHFSFDVEALWLARRLGHRIREVPVVWINHPESKVNPVRDSARMLKDLALLRLRGALGAYGPSRGALQRTGTP